MNYLKIYIYKQCSYNEANDCLFVCFPNCFNSLKTKKNTIANPNFMIFQVLPLLHFNRYTKSLFWTCSFFAKNQSKFVHPRLKIHNRYYHKQHTYNSEFLCWNSWVTLYQIKSFASLLGNVTTQIAIDPSLANLVDLL